MSTFLCPSVMKGIGAGLMLWTLGACAAAEPNQTADSSPTRSVRVSDICEMIMGLPPSDRPVTGVWPGNPPLPPVVSHYQTCIISLSDSLLQARSAEGAKRADTSCRARGLSPGSAELATCVLDSLSEHSEVSPTADLNVAAAMPARRASPYFYASAYEILRRERRACAQLGFEPPSDLFADCVRNLSENLFAIDNPIN